MNTIKKNIKGIFENDKIRKHKFNGEVFYVIEDVIKFIINSKNPHQYLKSLKNRNLDLKKGGKHKINCTNLNGIFKLIEFVPSKKIEEFKNHLYEIGLLKIEEVGE